MDDLTIARVIHVVAVLMWISGVAFATTVAMPAIGRQYDGRARLSAFHNLESGFSWQAKIWVLLAGASGFWTIFAVMLFVLEPLFLHKRMARSPSPEKDFRRMEIVHRVLLAGSIVATIGAVGGVHGLW